MENKCLIIAEAGVNHNGDIKTAKKLIDEAVKAKVDMIKFQTFKASDIVSVKAKRANYQVKQNESDTQLEMLKKLELSEADHFELINYCKIRNIKFFSTAFDIKGLNFLHSLNFDVFKIPSGEITNYPYLKLISSFKKPVILSTGMSTRKEIAAALSILNQKLNLRDITILHCNTEYPTPFEDVNLKAMISIQKEFGTKIGYSDHTSGIEVPIAATALGATVIEKHFTLSREMKGPDHKASIEPDELCQMVKSIRNIEKAISGSGIKEPSFSELKNLSSVRKSIHLAKDVISGEVINDSHLISLRPGNGISPMEWKKIIGRKTVINLSKYDMLSWEHLE